MPNNNFIIPNKVQRDSIDTTHAICCYQKKWKTTDDASISGIIERTNVKNEGKNTITVPPKSNNH